MISTGGVAAIDDSHDEKGWLGMIMIRIFPSL